MSPKSDRTARYREMRDFSKTPEPTGKTPAGQDRLRFVVQQHDATRLHWDLRLEHDGALPSWALPRGLPWSPDENHLAVHTEDHPLEYLDFHGEIPEGEYGAGTMTVWDTGTYEPDKWTDTKVTITLHGERAEGKYALFQTRGRDWMIHRMDPPVDPERRPIPTDLRPMIPTPGRLPRKVDQFAFELSWPGKRALIVNEVGRTTILSAGGDDISAKFPEVRRIHRALGSTEAVLDSVIVGVRSGAPLPDRDHVDHRLSVKADSTIRKLTSTEPVAAMLVDLLWLDGHPQMDLPWEERRELLEDLDLEADAWQVPSAHRGDGAALLEAARDNGLPGLIAKKLDSKYRSGAESKDWREIAG